MLVETSLVEEKLFKDGSAFVLWRKYRNFQTWYLLETFGPMQTTPCAIEYVDADKAFTAVERFEAKHT